MKTWEYKVIELSANLEAWIEDLNAMGNDGWELIQIDIFGTSAPAAFLKRETDG